MTYDPAKRDSTWRMVQPGCYIDPVGCGHVFPDEVIAHLQIIYPQAGFDFSEHDYDLIAATYSNMLRTLDPSIVVTVIKHERKADA
jgi:hypothetical protein